jgi:phage terminase large subunit-like protein
MGAVGVRWIEDNLILAEGDFFGQAFKLRADQKLFCYRWYEHCPECGQWRYDRALRMAATGDGKTQFFGALVCLEFAGPPEIAASSPNIPIAAASFEQADLLFKAVATMLGGEDNAVTEAPLCGFFEVYDTEIKFADGRQGRIYRVAAVAGTNEGGLPHLFACDELHEWGALGSNKARTHVVISKSTKKRRTPRGCGRVINISTAGFDVDNSLLGAMYKHAKRVLKDPNVDPRFLADIHEAPDGLNYEEPADRATAVKAASQGAGLMWNVADRVNAWADPGMQSHEWIRYFANRWVDIAEESWLAHHPLAWGKCQGDASIPHKADVVVAVDMALRRDSVAVLAAWKRPDGRVAVKAKIWRPAGGKIDHLAVVDYIRHDLAEAYAITEVTYDPRFFEVPARMLEDEGFNMVEFPQSVERMTPACGQALEAIVGGLVVHDGDPDFSAHVTSAVERPNERGFTLSKGKSKRKIDGAITLVIALWRIFAPEPEEEAVEPWVMFE